jgi:hypothetical protein
LEGLDRQPTLIVWQADAAALNQLRYWTDDMDQILCRLRIIRSVLPAAQQAEIKALTPSVIETTDSVQGAIRYLNRHQNALFGPSYTAYAPTIYKEASRAEAASAYSSQYMEANYTANQTPERQNTKGGS